MDRFPHIHLEQALASLAYPIHIVERVGPPTTPVFRVYPMNEAAQIGYAHFQESQGLTDTEYFARIPEVIPFFRAQWATVLVGNQKNHHYQTSVATATGEMRDFIASVYQVEWTNERAVAISIGNDITEQNATAKALQQANNAMAVQLEVIKELSVPVVALWDSVLHVPIVGTVDSRRAVLLTEALLAAITDQHAAYAIVDITGVSVVDTQVANYLIQTIRAAALLGCESLLVGIGPEIAQTMVQLGIDLSAIRTAATVQQGLGYALHQLGYHVQRQPKHATPARSPLI